MPLLAGPRSPSRRCGKGAAAMEPAGGKGARARRGTRPAAPRGRGAEKGAEKGAAPSPERGRVAGQSPSGAATPPAPRTDAPPARGSRSARRASAARELPAGGPASGAEAVPAPRSRAPAARAPAAPRSVAAVPDGAGAAPARRPPADALRLREVLSRLSLARGDVSGASTLVNLVVSHLIQAIRGKDSCFSSIHPQGAGSYYERVKVGAGAAAGESCSRPDELKLRMTL